MKRHFLSILLFLWAGYSYGQVENSSQIKSDSIVSSQFQTVYIGRRTGPYINVIGIQPIVQEMVLYDGWREKKIRWSNCRIAYPKQGTKPQSVILDGLPAEFEYINNRNLLGRNTKALTHRTYQETLPLNTGEITSCYPDSKIIFHVIY